MNVRLLPRFAGFLVAALVIPTALAATFSDVPSDNYYSPYIEKLATWGVVQGQNGMYRPNDPLTRAELTKIAVLSSGMTLNSSGSATFSDVPSTHSLFTYVETAARGGVVRGYPDGLFRPDNFITRGEAAKVVYGTMKLAANTTGGPHFSDVPVDHSFYLSVESLYNAGVLNLSGGAVFRVDQPITRAEMAELVVKTKDYVTGHTTSSGSLGGLTSTQTSQCILDRTITKKDQANNIIVQAYTAGEKAASNQPFGFVVKVTDLNGRPVPGLQLRAEVTEGLNAGSLSISEVGRSGVYLGSYTAQANSGVIVPPKSTLLITEQSNPTRVTGYEDVKAFPATYLSFPVLQSTNMGSVNKICWDLTRSEMTIDPNSNNQSLDNYIIVIGTAEDGNGVPVNSGITMNLYTSGDNSGTVSSSQNSGGAYAFSYQPSNSNSNDNTVTVKRTSYLVLQLVTTYRVFSSDQMKTVVTYLPRV